MAVSLLALIARLQSVAPVKKGIPADYQYYAEEGVAQLSLDAPIIRWNTLPLVAGTASYSLPSDFVSLVELPPVGYPYGLGGVGMSEGGKLLPLNAVAQGYEVLGGQITFFPTPTSAFSRPYRYAGGYVLDELTQIYPRLTPQGLRAALLYSRFLILLEQSGAQSHNGWSYTIGDETVTKSNLSKAIESHANMLKDQYDATVDRLRASYGSRSEATVEDYMAAGEIPYGTNANYYG